ncbi:MAG: ABC transporter permease [Phycisphaerae bacterium]|nr:ABC transporter permease [Phycisphaerae bacterium]
MARLPLDYAVRNLGRSPLRAGLSVLGAGLVVLLVIAAAGFVTGMSRSLRASGDDRHVILLGAGSEESIERSEIAASVGSLVAAAVPGLQTSMGAPHVSAEVHVQLPVRSSPDAPNPRLLLIRGVTPGAMLVHRSVQITEGRFPRAGHDEIMLGSAAPRQLGLADADLAVGGTLWIDKAKWTIVGRFAAPGTVMQAEAWTALTDLKAATKRETDSCVELALGDAEFADIDAFARQRLDLELTAVPETRYYAGLASFFRPVQAVVWATALLIAAGGLLGGLNTMYAAFSSRVRELGMLQCLGYRRSAIVLSLVQESLLAAGAGAVLACVAGLALLDGLAVRFSTGVFGLVVDHTVVALGLAAGLALGLIGALPPALRALRLPIAESLKAA